MTVSDKVYYYKCNGNSFLKLPLTVNLWEININGHFTQRHLFPNKAKLQLPTKVIKKYITVIWLFFTRPIYVTTFIARN